MPYGMVTLLDSGEAVPHRLTREETMVCIEGRAFASLSGEIFEMTPGSAIVIPPDTEFSIRNPHATPRHAMPCHAIPGRCRAPSRRTGDHRRPAAVHPTVGKLRKSLAGSLWLVNVYGRVRAVGQLRTVTEVSFEARVLNDSSVTLSAAMAPSGQAADCTPIGWHCPKSAE